MAGEYIEFNNNSQPALNDTNINRLQQLIKQDIQGAVSGDTLPVGVIMPYGSDTIPDNWLLCNGQAISRTTYQDLFNTIGTTYGSGDGFTTFNVPDLRGKVAVGKDDNDTDFDTLGETGGEKTHTLTIDEIPSHKHGIPINSYVNTDSQTSTQKGGHVNNGSAGVNYETNSKGGGQAHNNLQPYIVQNYIIKAKQSAGIVATVVDNLTSTSTTNALSANQGKVLKEKIEDLTTYSTEEKIVGTWIDGKPLYEITLTGTKQHGSDLEIALPTNIENAFIVSGSLKTSSKAIYNLDRTENENYTRTQIHYDLNKFVFKSSGLMAYFDGEVVATIRYTKTTD